jgi:hypothetical protein
MPYKWDFKDTIGAEFNTVCIRPMSEYDPSFFEAEPAYKQWVIGQFRQLTSGNSNEAILEILVGVIERQREGNEDDDTNDYYVRECVASLAGQYDLNIGKILVMADEHHRRMTYVGFEAQEFVHENWHLFVPFSNTVNLVNQS